MHSSKELLTLAAVEMNAGKDIGALAKLTGLRPSALRYHLQRLKESGVIINKRAYINVFLLGYTNYVIYCTLGSSTREKREAVVAQLQQYRRVGWIAELGGEYQFAFSVSVKAIGELASFLDEVAIALKSPFFQKAVSVRLSYQMYPRSYLASKDLRIKPFVVAPGAPVETDQLDQKVLSAVSLTDFESRAALAKKAGIPLSTFERRLSRLEEIGVIVGYFCRLDLSRLGIQQYRLLISVRGMQPKLRKELIAFAAAHPRIRKFIECTGSWDCEMELNVADSSEASAVSASLYERFGYEVNSVSVIPLFRQINPAPYSLV
jgi:DNA-binding Lrp family transcriptional regulator